MKKKNRETDAELVRAARAGYKTAFATLFSRYQPGLLVICRRVLADPILAEDAAQEAALQAFLGLDRLYRAERFGSWLVGIGLNVCRRWLRDRLRSCSSVEVFLGGQATGELLHPDAGPDEIAEERELAEIVRAAVDDLPAGQRSAVLLFYLAGLTHSETASLLGIEAGAVKTRLHKARAALRRQLQSLWKEDHMRAEIESQSVEVMVADVRRRRAEGGRPAHCMLLLKEVGGDRSLPIWIGPAEGTAISLMLEKVEVPRPLTFAFMGSMLEAAGGKLVEVVIQSLVDDTFYAVAIVAGRRGSKKVDARPSDALALALVTGARVGVEPGVFDRSATTHAAHPEATKEAFFGEGTEGRAEIAAAALADWRAMRKEADDR